MGCAVLNGNLTADGHYRHTYLAIDINKIILKTFAQKKKKKKNMFQLQSAPSQSSLVPNYKCVVVHFSAKMPFWLVVLISSCQKEFCGLKPLHKGCVATSQWQVGVRPKKNISSRCSLHTNVLLAKSRLWKVFHSEILCKTSLCDGMDAFVFENITTLKPWNYNYSFIAVDQ